MIRAGVTILVVGAGAVGQVLGRHLQLGGAEVTFFVRENYRAETARGFDMFPLNHWRRGSAPIRFEGFGVVSTAREVAALPVAQVFLTVPSTGLRGEWLANLVHAIGDATVVSLQPGPDDRATILASGVASSRLVTGLIGFLSYAAPLPAETGFPRAGTAYWFPPLGRSPFSGPDTPTAAALAALTRGRVPARRHRDVPGASAFSMAIMMAYLLALESAGWSLRTFVTSRHLAAGVRAAREASAIVAGAGTRPPLGARVAMWPAVIRLALWVGGRALPFPLEAYLARHFAKVGAQTRLIVASVIASGKARALPVAALEELLAAAGGSVE